MTPLPLAEGARPCVGSGFCCKKSPCPFGDVTSDTDRSCRHLVLVSLPERHPRYTCGIYDQIIGRPGWEFAPAFGAGCCSPLFNEARQAIIREINESKQPSVELRLHHFGENDD